MRQEDFFARLYAATYAAILFGQEHVDILLPKDVVYLVCLNQSYDENRESDEVVYPVDDDRIEAGLDANGVVNLLHRNERVPQWIDISVLAADDSVTLIRLRCCGRYHIEDERLYYFSTGFQPFGIKSPEIPYPFRNGGRFPVPTPAQVFMDPMKFSR